MRRLMRRLRPLGPCFVHPRWLRNPIYREVYVIGVKDGWAQPRELSTSTDVAWAVDYLNPFSPDMPWPYDVLDTGINLGQWLRSPFNHQQREA